MDHMDIMEICRITFDCTAYSRIHKDGFGTAIHMNNFALKSPVNNFNKADFILKLERISWLHY